mmetsp:Transcript_60778/g.125810  ORF Transcript_60778/g.125810 Transcript_60778/m.125810 type:complete len:207 (+) Transcript_60778:62-682(+)
MAAVSRQRPAAGEALRQRLAAQADAALAEGPDNPLRVLLSQPEGTREDAKSRLEAAERLLLERPKPKALEDKAPLEEEETNLQKLRRAAKDGNLEGMAKMDRHLRALLEDDDMLRSLEGKDFEDPTAQAALRLYQDSMCYGRPGGDVDKLAFQAVMRDDAAALRNLIRHGLDLETTNAGGQTLLQLAQERGKEVCAQVLLREGAQP